jgi:hypothetical protein
MNDAKYGPETRAFQLETGAEVAVTIVINGKRGHGMATAAKIGAFTPHQLGAILRIMADEADRAIAAGETFETVRTYPGAH